MKFNKIIAICKKHGKFTIVTKHNVNGEAEYQLLGDGLAVYPLYGHPIYDDDIEVYWRAEQRNGNNVFAVKTGLNLSALILGSKSLIPDTMVNELAKILLALRKESEGK